VQLIILKEGPSRADRHVVLLTRRERQILRLLSCGQLNKEIAYSLRLSLSTIKNYVAKFIALGLANRVQIARWAMLHPEVFSAGHAVDIALHLPGCPCDHPRCIEMRKLDDKAA